MATDLYISLDVEADGPIPGPTGWGRSTLSLGACVAGDLDDAIEQAEPFANVMTKT